MIKTLFVAPNKGYPFNEAWAKETMILANYSDRSFFIGTGKHRKAIINRSTIDLPHSTINVFIIILTYFVLGIFAKNVVIEINPKMSKYILFSILPFKSKIIIRLRKHPADDVIRKYASFFKKINKVLVFEDHLKQTLSEFNVKNVIVVDPFISEMKLIDNHDSNPGNKNFATKILFASSPLSHQTYPEIFEQKGIYNLIKFAKNHPKANVIMLWRDAFTNEINDLVDKNHIKNVQIINKRVNILNYFNKTNITILVTSDTNHTPAFPSSLMESVVYGNPVIVTDNFSFSKIVSKHKIGLVIPSQNIDLNKAMSTMEHRYREYRDNCINDGRNIFTNISSTIKEINA